jgi:hypothetical protein
MPDEPNKNMDALLRAYAKKRGEFPEAPMHPATRRMLQAEARRIHGVAGPARGWRAFIPQIVFGTALGLIIGLTTAVLMLAPQEQKFAKTESLNVEREVDTFALTTDLPALKLGVDFKDERESQPSSLRRERQLSFSGPEGDQARLAKVPAPVVQAAARADTSYTQRFENVPRHPSADQAVVRAETPAARPEPLARASELTNLGAALRTRFVQTNLSRPSVLLSFQVEQLGEQVRVVDLDGSIYLGTLQTRSNAPAGIVLLSNADRELAENAAVYSFQASGTNRTLGSMVEIQGRYFDKTNLPGPENVIPRFTRGLAPAQPSRRIIVGRTVVGTNEFPLRALSVER